MNNWYDFMPVDTLFCKGAEPMSMGENHTASHLFPSPAQTIAGAVRTAVLLQNDIPFEDYAKGRASPNIIETIGEAGKTPPFEIVGPFFKTGNDIFIPAPYSFYVEDKNYDKETVKVYKIQKIASSLINTGSSDLYWAKGETGQLVSLGGMWAKLQDIVNGKYTVNIKKDDEFFILEPRTGIALHQNRRVREGHLYSFSHARLKKEVSLVFGIDMDVPLAETGVLKIGAEQRFGKYKKLSKDSIQFIEQGSLFMALSLVEGTEKANKAVVATGKIMYLGGWDLHKGFHKPMKGYFLPGTVFNKKLNNNFITIQGG